MMPGTIEILSLVDARQLIAHAEAKAAELEVPSNIAVVDASGNLVAFVRMEDAWLGSTDIAIHKAFTARAFDMSTEELGKMAQTGKPLFGIEATNEGRIVIFGGGVPIKRGDAIIGAIGSSRGTVDQEVEITEAAAAAFEGKPAESFAVRRLTRTAAKSPDRLRSRRYRAIGPPGTSGRA